MKNLYFHLEFLPFNDIIRIRKYTDCVSVTDPLTSGDIDIVEVRYGHKRVAICHIRIGPAGRVSFNV